MRALLFLCAVTIFLFTTSPGLGQEAPIKAKCLIMDNYVLLEDVVFKYLANGKALENGTTKKGKIKFTIIPEHKEALLTLEKPGYITKEVVFATGEYPFEKRYNSMRLELEMFPKEENGPTILRYTLGFSRGKSDYDITSIDTIYSSVEERLVAAKEKSKETVEKIQPKKQAPQNTDGSPKVTANEEGAEQPTTSSSTETTTEVGHDVDIDAIFDKAMKNADALWALEEYEFSRGYYEIVLEIDPKNEHALNQLKSIPEAVANRNAREKERIAAANRAVKPSGKYPSTEWYSVQIGAFIDKINEEEYANVPDYQLIEGEQYKRCFSGIFNTRTEAANRLKLIKNLGFRDAFIVTMQGAERIGF